VTDAGPAKPEVAKSRRGTETVLVVDDDEMLRRAARRVLELNGYRVIVAEDGEAAMRTMQESYGLVDLVFTDMMMPRMGGGELHQRVTSELGPKKFLIASGHARTEAQGADGLPPNVPFIAKPWTLDELLDAVRSALDAPGLPRPH
jgi:DNA-binding NtrC family response regulator